MFTKKTLVKDFDELIEHIKYFENHPEEYITEVEKQRKKLDYYCFERPANELFKQFELKKK